MTMKNLITNSIISNSKMLNLSETNIKIFRLQNGEDIIANFEQLVDTDIIKLIRPMHLIFKRIPTGRTVMMMMPWLPIELIKENSAEIFDSDILTIIEPKDDLVEYYIHTVNDSNVEAALDASIREALFQGGDEDDDDDEEPTDAQLDEEELLELLKQRRNSNVH